MKRREAIQLITISGAAAAAGQAQHEAHSASKAAGQAGAAARKGAHKPKYFSPQEYATLVKLADMIIPRDSTPGALDAGVPQWIDEMVAEIPDAQVRLSGGFQWFDHHCNERFGNDFIRCTPEQQKQVVDSVAYEKNVTPQNRRGRLFFYDLRDWVCFGFYSSRLGYKEVGYQGNVFVPKFEGCTHPEHNG